MNWLHLCDLFKQQIDSVFPDGSIRPYAADLRKARTWEAAEKLFRSSEAQLTNSVEAALWEFISHGSWPKKLTAKERMWINARLRRGREVTLNLAVPINLADVTLQANVPTEEIMRWLLFLQWYASGLDGWMLDIKISFHQARNLKLASPSWN